MKRLVIFGKTLVSDIEYFAKIEQLLENQIASIKKMSYLFSDSQGLIKNMSLLVNKTRELKGLANGR